ncbi:hypothetical protein APS_0922 [Acetobacter pasteurianus subsp. pasteurianus LMG 1262 = NBRC 106471]|nr:hypothetical protein APS_0922 [Acetobacter pasteurianus subsp. pasteurianus LMG 1262 = NBRC 106471]
MASAVGAVSLRYTAGVAVLRMKKHSIRKIPSPHNINSAQGTHLGSFFLW